MEFNHAPVMLQECLSALNIKPNGIYLDGTAGGAGHSVPIAKQLKNGHLYSIDQDPTALKTATARLSGLPATVLAGNFGTAASILSAAQPTFDFENGFLDGALLDLGVSSHQLDEASRGFSYLNDAPLDMRMSQSGPTAADIVNTASRQEIADILRNYGEESHAWSIAGVIIKAREEAEIESTLQLAEIISRGVPPAVRRKSKNPARKSFQALRIAVNCEMDALDTGLNEIFALLKPGGRFAVISFHSLEDRMVKQRFKQWQTGCTCPSDFPICVCGKMPSAKAVGKNPQTASEEELEVNRRSRSAKLRVIEKL